MLPYRRDFKYVCTYNFKYMCKTNICISNMSIYLKIYVPVFNIHVHIWPYIRFLYGKARQVYLYSTFHIQRLFKVLYIYKKQEKKSTKIDKIKNE